MGIDLEAKAAVGAFGSLVGASKAALGGLVRRGVLPAGGTAGQWLQAYCGYLRAVAAGRAGDSNLADERRGLTSAKRRRAELELRLREGELLEKEGVRRGVQAMAVDVLTAYSNLEGHMVPLLSGDQRRALGDELRAAQAEVHASMCRRVPVTKDMKPAAGDG